MKCPSNLDENRVEVFLSVPIAEVSRKLVEIMPV